MMLPLKWTLYNEHTNNWGNKGMKKVVALALMFGCGVAQAQNRQMMVEFDVNQLRPIVANEANSAGFVVIGSVDNKRRQPYLSGGPVLIESNNREVQIGSIDIPSSGKKGSRRGQYDILIKDQTIESFVRDIVALGFNRAGYAVLSAGDARATNVPKVDIEIESFWLWGSSLKSSQRMQFNSDLMVSVIGADAPFREVGRIQSTGILNGGTGRGAKSYQNTMMVMKDKFLDSFVNAVHRSVLLSETSVHLEGE
jgi:hypothetical protein